MRTHATTCLAMVAIVMALQSPARAKDSFTSPFFAGSVLRQGDTLRSGGGCVEMAFHYNGIGYLNRLDVVTIGGAGCGGVNWDSWSDFDWQGYGQGTHQSASEPRGRRAAEAVMQADGNFVIYDIQDGSAVPVWSTSTAGNPGAYLTEPDDGNMVIYSASTTVLWSLV
jgi:hypothetical protein